MPPLPRPPEPPAELSAEGKECWRGFAVLNAFIDCSMANLSRAELATWFVLYRDTRNGTACTSAEHIAKRIGASRRAVTAALAKLCQRGLLVQVFRGGINRGPSRFRVTPTGKPPG